VGQELVFVVHRSDGAAPIYHFNQIRRAPCLIKQHSGRFIRYNRHLHRLYPADEIRELLREIRATGSVPFGWFRHAKFSKAFDVALPFMKLWEAPIALYPETAYR
jgi:hypothetical protein